VSLLASPLAAEQRPAYSPEQLSLIRHVAEAQLAPDGRSVAFVTDITGALELWTVPAEGGWPTQLTNLGEAVSDIRWSPDSRWLVFSADAGGNERHDLYRVPAAGGLVEKLTDTPFSEQQPRFSPDGKQLAFVADPDPMREFLFQLHVLDLESRKVRQLTREPVNVLAPVWSPDGTTLAVTRSGDDQKGELLLIELASGRKVEVPPPEAGGILWPQAFAPDGKSLLVLARNNKGFLQMALVPSTRPAAGNNVLTWLGPDDADITDVHWHKEGTILFLQESEGATRLGALESPKAAQPLVLLPARGVIRQLSASEAGQVAVLREDVQRPADVWRSSSLLPGKEAEFRQVTFSLLGGVRPEELSAGEMLTYESFDKRRVQALVIQPRRPRLGSPPPAVVYVHGGPNGQVTRSFDPFFQVLAEAGFAVIAPNYRGSTGYGKAFEDLNNKDWGGGDRQDLVAAVRHFGQRGLIDPCRVGISGGSYGGYLTLMALCKDPDVFAAGVELYGMPDLVMDYLLCKSRFADWYETEMGNPTTAAALFRDRSPLPYLDRIRSPLLIFQGANDSNVPRAESDLLAAVLKQLNKPHEYTVYDDEGHGFVRRKNLLDFYQRTTAFFVKHLGEKK
jgi:dipeptidyl aminopeptidase/acylaminoacyl peptidase